MIIRILIGGLFFLTIYWKIFSFITLICLLLFDCIDFFTLNKEFRKLPERHLFDKAVDLINYISVFCYTCFYDNWLFIIFLILFIWRIFCNIHYILYDSNIIFYLCPNLFMKLFIFTSIVESFFPTYFYIFTNPQLMFYIILFVLIISVIAEYIIHTLLSEYKEPERVIHGLKI